MERFMKSKTDEEIKPTSDQTKSSITSLGNQPFVFEPGDIFLVSNPKESKPAHFFVKLGQRVTGNRNSEYFHAGLAVSKKNLVEMGNEEGMHLSEASSLDGSTLAVFRCKNKEIAQLAADLAANVESSLITDEYKGLKTEKEKVNYAMWKAISSVISNAAEISEQGKMNANLLTQNFEFPTNMFCSEMVVIFYTLAANILGDDNKYFNVESEINPSVLYRFLTTRGKDNFEEMQMSFDSKAYLQNIEQLKKDSVEPMKNETNSQGFKEAVSQIKNNDNVSVETMKNGLSSQEFKETVNQIKNNDNVTLEQSQKLKP